MRSRPSLRLTVILLLALPLAHCSCQRDPGADTTATVTAEAELSVPAAAPAPADAATAAADAAAARAANLAASTLHAYLGALPAGDRSRADAYWSGGRPGSPAGDELLRGIDGLRSMQVRNDPPQALDRESPPRAFEIPVRLRLDTVDGPAQVAGSYRLRSTIDGRGWEITSASLHPVLD